MSGLWFAFLRGINLGQRQVKMAELRTCLEAAGFAEVKTVVASGNVRLRAAGTADVIKEKLEAAIAALEAQGFSHSELSLVLPHTQPTAASTADTSDGTGAGATIGTALGGGVGLLAGLGLLAIPGVGPLVAAGWAVAALTGAGAGALTGGVVGALTGAPVPAGVPYFWSEQYASTLQAVGAVRELRHRAVQRGWRDYGVGGADRV